MEQFKMKRRTFLKTTAATAAFLGTLDAFSIDEWAKKASAAEIQKVPSLCGSCSSKCGMWVYVKNGRVWRADGQKDEPNSKGKLCARGHAALKIPYHKDRIIYPMKRLGENNYVPISWEQAYTEIATKLKDIIAKYGTEPIFYSENPKSTSSFYFKRLMKALGVSTTTTHHSMCFNSRTSANDYTIGSLANADIGNAKYVLFLGRNYVEGLSPSNAAKLATASESDTKLVIVDPRHSAACMLADEWVPIKPGTDLGLLLAIAHVLIKENLYDKEFVAQYGLGFDEFKEEVMKWTPEWAEGVTSIPKEKIYDIARSLGQNRPQALIEQGYKSPSGSNYINGVDTFRVLAMINALLGNYGKKGGMGWQNSPKMGSLNKDKYPEPPKTKTPRCDGMGIKGEHPLGPVSAGSIPEIARKAMDGKIKAGFVYSINPVRNSCGYNYMKEAFEKIDLLVVCDIEWSETARVADYVLPECTFLEREDLPEAIKGGRAGASLRTQVIDKIHSETKTCSEIVAELSEHLGVGKYFNFSQNDVAEAMLKPMNMTMEELREKGCMLLPAPAAKPIKFKTPSGKIQFASPEFAEAGYSKVPTWKPPLAVADGNNFALVAGKQAIMSHSFSNNHRGVLEIAKEYNLERLWINTARAKKLGLKTGDLVEMESKTAKRKIRVKVTERVHPDVVWLPLGYGTQSPWRENSYGFGVNPNDMNEFRVDPISGTAILMETLVTLKKVGE